MAQGQSNLTAGFVVDISGLKTGLATANAEIRKFTSQLNAAVKAGNDEAKAAAQQNLQGAIRLRDQLTAAIKKQTVATTEATAAHRAEARSLSEIAREAGHVAHTIGLSVEGIKALRYGFAAFAAAVAIRQVRDVVGELNELQNTIKRIGGASGTSVEELKKSRDAVAGIGGAASIADDALETFNKNLDASRQKAGQGGVQIARGGRGEPGASEVLRGGGGGGTVRDVSTVLRGGLDQEKVDWNDINKALDINTSRLRSNNGIKAEQAKKILAITDATTRDKAAMAATNHTFAESEALLRQWAGLPPKALTDLEKFNTALTTLHRQWADFTEDLVSKYLPSITAALDGLAGSGWAEEIKRQIDFATYDFQQLQQAAERFAAWWRRMDEALKAGHDALWAGLQPRGPGGVPLDPSTPALSPNGNAAGGYIRGAGSGTSDSILARLSNGEYVINARSVARLGIARLNQLNRFANGGYADEYTGFGGEYTGGDPYSGPRGSTASEHGSTAAMRGFGGAKLLSQIVSLVHSAGYSLGGLVGAEPLRFANGGPVGSGGSSAAQVPINLHLGGQVFAASAATSVASALVSEAHRQAVTSAGVKPSWFAARPGGR